MLLTDDWQADRAARFVKAHSLLQSRTTTKAEDIPLILMNMSSLNANAISQNETIDTRMKQLFYSLESFPTELLFSDCARLGSCTVDAWIPREVAPESFMGEHTLKLGSAGFTFKTEKGAGALLFFLLSSERQLNRFQLLLREHRSADVKYIRYNVEALQRSNDKQPAAPTGLLCTVIDNGPPARGARLVVNRVVGHKYFLHFDCPLRLTKIDESNNPSDTQQDPKRECDAVNLTGEFIIERNYEPQELTISRPQNPEQFPDRLTFIGLVIWEIIGLGDRYLTIAIWSDESITLVLICYCFYCYMKKRWVNKALNAFMYQAWMATYQPDWNPHGPWKWFWKLLNWEPPMLFVTLTKFLSACIAIHYWVTKDWTGVATVTLYWDSLHLGVDLVSMYVMVILIKVLPPLSF